MFWPIGWEQSGVGCMPPACSLTPGAVVLGPTRLHEHGSDWEYDAPASSRQLQSSWLPLCLPEDGQQSHRYLTFFCLVCWHHQCQWSLFEVRLDSEPTFEVFVLVHPQHWPATPPVSLAALCTCTVTPRSARPPSADSTFPLIHGVHPHQVLHFLDIFYLRKTCHELSFLS